MIGHDTPCNAKRFGSAKDSGSPWEIVAAKAAEMVIEPGQAEGGPRNRHRGADQWLFVVDGTGVARIEGRRYPLKAGVLLLIEHGDQHEIRNTGRSLLKTLNIYSPPAYTRGGDELPRAKP